MTAQQTAAKERTRWTVIASDHRRDCDFCQAREARYQTRDRNSDLTACEECARAAGADVRLVDVASR